MFYLWHVVRRYQIPQSDLFIATALWRIFPGNKEVKRRRAPVQSFGQAIGGRLGDGALADVLPTQTLRSRNKSGDYVMVVPEPYGVPPRLPRKASGIPENSELEVTFIEEPISAGRKPVYRDVLSSAGRLPQTALYRAYLLMAERLGSMIQGQKNAYGGGVRITWKGRGRTGDETAGLVLWPGQANISLSEMRHENQALRYPLGLDRSSFRPDRCPADGGGVYALEEQHGLGLLLEEVPDAALKVDIAGHEHDSDRKLWYCDIQIDAAPITVYPRRWCATSHIRCRWRYRNGYDVVRPEIMCTSRLWCWLISFSLRPTVLPAWRWLFCP